MLRATYKSLGTWRVVRRLAQLLRCDSLVSKTYYRHQRCQSDIAADGLDYLRYSRDHDPRTVVSYVVDRLLEGVAQPSRALDICCGTGRYLRELADRCGGIGLEGWDISADAITRFAEPRVSNAQYHVVDVENLHASMVAARLASYDLIYCITAVQYFSVRRVQDIVHTVAKMLRADGRFAVVFPRRGGRNSRYVDAIGFRCYTLEELRAICAKSGLEVVRAERLDHVFQGHHLMIFGPSDGHTIPD